MSEDNDDFEDSLRRGIDQTKAQLAEIDALREPVLAELHKRESALRSYLAGSKGSRTISDEEIIDWLRHNSATSNRKLAPEIAAGVDVDPRGLSKRLPRMARQKIIAGDHQSGYYLRNGRKAA